MFACIAVFRNLLFNVGKVTRIVLIVYLPEDQLKFSQALTALRDRLSSKYLNFFRTKQFFDPLSVLAPGKRRCS